MAEKKLKPIFILMITIGMIWANLIQAQESVNTTSGNASGSGGTIAYSVGQVVYTTITDTSCTISQGVQQAYEIFKVEINETEINILISVFPNPTANNLTLTVGDYSNQKLLYQFFDMQGKLLNNGQVTTKHTQINTDHLPAATYFINVLNQENKKILTYKIIKR